MPRDFRLNMSCFVPRSRAGLEGKSRVRPCLAVFADFPDLLWGFLITLCEISREPLVYSHNFHREFLTWLLIMNIIQNTESVQNTMNNEHTEDSRQYFCLNTGFSKAYRQNRHKLGFAESIFPDWSRQSVPHDFRLNMSCSVPRSWDHVHMVG